MVIDELFSVEGKTAIVTGGSRGLGFALAKGLAMAGANVAILARDAGRVQAAVEEIRSVTGSGVLGVAGDVTREEDVGHLVRLTVEQLGPLDVLVANAAAINRPRQMAWEMGRETWDEIVAVTLTGTFLPCQRALREMIPRRRGKIICVASTSSVVASRGHAPYVASKGGVLLLVRALALEAAPYGVNVNAIGPTYINTEMTAVSLQDPERRKAILAQLPLGRVLEPEDLLGACIFLASKASDMVTGHLLMVDAGHTIH